MKLFLLFALALAGVCLTHAGIYTRRHYLDFKHPGKCVVDGKVLSPGQRIKHPIMDCAEIRCDDSNGMTTIETCDPISVLVSPLQKLKNYGRPNPPKCTWGDFKNTKAEYPKCCERHFTCAF